MKFNKQDVVSNHRFYMEPHSFGTFSFEKELRRNKIQFYKDDLSVLQPYIVYSVLEKDLDMATQIFDNIQQDEYKQKDLIKQKKKDKKKAERRTLEYRQKQISLWILILIGIIIISMLIF